MKSLKFALIIILVLMTRVYSVPVTGKVLELTGSAFLNGEALKQSSEFELFENDTLIVHNNSNLKISFGNDQRLWVKDSTVVVLNKLFFELKLGLIRLQIPEINRERKNFVVYSGDLITSVMHGSTLSDFSMKKTDDSVLVGVYKGDSLMIQKVTEGEKSLNDVHYLEKYSSVSWVASQLSNKCPVNETFLDPSIWGVDFSYAEYLIEKLEIEKAAAVLNLILRSNEMTGDEKIKTYYYLAYLRAYDNDKNEMKNYFNEILILDPDFELSDEFVSPKIVEAYQSAYSQYKKEMKLLSNKTSFFELASYSLVPGLYQLKQKKTVRGLALLGANICLWSGFIYHNSEQNNYEGLAKKAVDRKEAFRYYDKATDNYDRKRLFFYSVLSTYALNIVDSYFINSKLKPTLTQHEDKIYLSINVNF